MGLEIIRWISLVLLWFMTGLNMWMTVRGIRLNKRLKSTREALGRRLDYYEGRPPVKFCHECEYSKKATVNDKGFFICPASGMEITSHDYCSYFDQMKEKDNETDAH